MSKLAYKGKAYVDEDKLKTLQAFHDKVMSCKDETTLNSDDGSLKLVLHSHGIQYYLKISDDGNIYLSKLQ